MTTEADRPRIPEHLREASRRAKAARTSSTATAQLTSAATNAPKNPGRKSGPSAGRVVAAAASVSAGIGLVALTSMASAQADIVVQVEPAPIVVSSDTPMTPASQAEPAIRVIEAPTSVPTTPGATEPAPQPVTESEGS